MLAEMPLHELRQARRLSQETLAEALHIGQASVSKMERRTDMYVSTLRGIIRAMGGELEIIARFPDGVYRIGQFGGLDAPRKERNRLILRSFGHLAGHSSGEMAQEMEIGLP